MHPPTDLDANLKAKLAVTTKKVFRSLEKPEDVVARVLLSQVGPLLALTLAIELNMTYGVA